jgi:DNA invertase Pin-like site-specific DNA recombinase
MLLGYARVSTDAQSLEAKMAALNGTTSRTAHRAHGTTY